ncbi:hypothetical protein T459_31819 [Capsicum annuum]|uniref:Uncharacterized protein n=1 Tax=Capsicum annuum TaxID=4072 RepID=A0A2G2Y3I1_CAPAN|nr:hypothetical protein T459_31819 [Capsicum annuum]
MDRMEGRLEGTKGSLCKKLDNLMEHPSRPNQIPIFRGVSCVYAHRTQFAGSWPNLDAKWETCVAVGDFYWKQITEPVMSLYTETTDGSFIDRKDSTLVWNYQYADPDFGSCQAKELLDDLESVLANELVTVKSGHDIVEVKPQASNMMYFSQFSLKILAQIRIW